MHPSLWCYLVTQFQFLFGTTSNDQEDQKQETKEPNVGSHLREQLDAPKETSNVAQKQSATTKTKRFRSWKIGPPSALRQLSVTKVSEAVFPSARQLEGATHVEEAGVADEVKSQSQVALGLLAFSASAILSTLVAFLARRQAGQNLAVAGGQKVNLPGLSFWWSITLWHTCLLFSALTVLATTFWKKSPGLLFYTKCINAFNVCVFVAGVALFAISCI